MPTKVKVKASKPVKKKARGKEAGSQNRASPLSSRPNLNCAGRCPRISRSHRKSETKAVSLQVAKEMGILPDELEL